MYTKEVKSDRAANPLPILKITDRQLLADAVSQWRTPAAQKLQEAVKGQWIMEIIHCLESYKGDNENLCLSSHDDDSRQDPIGRLNILGQLDENLAEQKILVRRAMDSGAHIAQGEYNLVNQDDAKIRSAYSRLKMFMNKLNAQMDRANSEATPIAHLIDEANFTDDMPNPLSGIIV